MGFLDDLAGAAGDLFGEAKDDLVGNAADKLSEATGLDQLTEAVTDTTAAKDSISGAYDSLRDTLGAN